MCGEGWRWRTGHPSSRQLRHDLSDLAHLPHPPLHHPASPLPPQSSSAAALSHTSLRQRACRGRCLPSFPLIASISLTCPHGGNQRARDAGHAHRDQGALPRPHQEVQAAAQGPRSPCASRKGSFSPPGRPGSWASAWRAATRRAIALQRRYTDSNRTLQLRALLQVTADEDVVFERYSDSTASYVTLESDKPQIYKTLFRAAKAKLKLRLRATVPGEQPEAPVLGLAPSPEAVPQVLSLERPSADTLRPQTVAPVSPVIVRSPVANPPAPKFEPVSPVSPAQPQHAAVSPRLGKVMEQLASEHALTV
jgi:hypothetical protein